MTKQSTAAADQVQLTEQRGALALLHSMLTTTAQHYAADFAEVGVPEDVAQFRRTYAAVLPRFELARLTSTDSSAIARTMLDQFEQQVVFGADQQRLSQALVQPVEPLPLHHHEWPGTPGWQPNLVYRGQRYQGGELAGLGQDLCSRGMISTPAADALTWLMNAGVDDGVLNLSGRKIVMLGGGAEMAPTRLWLEAGADVLWLDTAAPPQEWFEATDLTGRLSWSPTGADLLTQPQQILATLIEFANGLPLDLGLYAYAPGQLREVRLTAALNALVNALPPSLVSSVTLLVSPTTPTAVGEDDTALMLRQLAQRPRWESVCAHAGLLGRGHGHVVGNGFGVTRTVVDIQGASYQLAQYVGKVLTAEAWADLGLRVSANTAAITRTRSLSHPVFAAAFVGAGALGVETMTPRQSRRLNGLLAVRDWLYPELPRPGLVRVHGGIHTLGYPLQSALRLAAGLGFARSPRLIKGLLSR